MSAGRWTQHLLAALGVGIISLSAIFVRLAGVSPVTAALFRMIYALPVLLVLYALIRRHDRRSLGRRLMAFGGGVVLAVDLSLWHTSIGLIGAGLATVLANIQVIFVGVMAWVLFGERPTGKAFTMVPVVLTGVALISGLGRPDAYGVDPVLGVFLGLLSGACYAAFLLLFRSSNRGLAPAAGPLTEATLGAALGAFAIGLLDPGFSLAVTWPAHGWLLLLGLFPSVLGWLLISTALPRLPALETSVLLLMQPMVTVVWAQIIFREALSPIQWGGVLLVLGGIAAVTLGGGAVREVRALAEP